MIYFLGKLFLVTKFQNTVSAQRNIDGSQTSNFDSERQEVKLHIWKRRFFFKSQYDFLWAALQIINRTQSIIAKVFITFLVGFRFTRTSCGAVLPIKRMGTAWKYFFQSLRNLGFLLLNFDIIESFLSSRYRRVLTARPMSTTRYWLSEGSVPICKKIFWKKLFVFFFSD